MKRVALCIALLLALAPTGCIATGDKPEIEKESNIHGIPPLWWYRSGESGYVVVPFLLSYLGRDKEKTVTLGALGLAHFGLESRKYDENDLISEKSSLDLNFLGIWSSWGMEKANGGKINKMSEGMLLGGLFGVGSLNNKYYVRLLWFRIGASDAPPIDRMISCPVCKKPVKYYDLECANCGQLYK
jgi:hypothetical protein